MGNCCGNSVDNMLGGATYENTPTAHPDFTRAKVLKVYDGDTFHVAAVVHDKVCRYKCRLGGVDCPEMRDADPRKREAANRARQFTVEFCLGQLVNIRVWPNLDKYGRLLVSVENNGRDLAAELIRYDLAIKYNL